MQLSGVEARCLDTVIHAAEPWLSALLASALADLGESRSDHAEQNQADDAEEHAVEEQPDEADNDRDDAAEDGDIGVTDALVGDANRCSHPNQQAPEIAHDEAADENGQVRVGEVECYVHLFSFLSVSDF